MIGLKHKVTLLLCREITETNLEQDLQVLGCNGFFYLEHEKKANELD